MRYLKRSSLPGIVFLDIVKNNKLFILLLFLVVATAFLKIWVTQKTRYEVTVFGRLLMQKADLEERYQNLATEKQVITRRQYIQQKAELKGLSSKKILEVSIINYRR